jgi:hypothetical protein
MVTLTSAGPGRVSRIDRPSGVKGRCPGGVGKFGGERALHLIDDQAWDAGQSVDEDDARVDGGDLFAQLSLAVRGDLSAEHDHVDRSSVEACGYVGEVVGRFGPVAEVAEAGERVVEDEFALADQQYAPLGVVGCDVGSFPSCAWLGVGSDSEARRQR